MRKLALLIATLFAGLCAVGQTVPGNNSPQYYFKGTLAVGKNDATAASASALLEIGNGSDTKGMLPPRIADTGVVSSPVEGLFAYDKSTKVLRFFDGTQWKQVGSDAVVTPTLQNVTAAGNATTLSIVSTGAFPGTSNPLPAGINIGNNQIGAGGTGNQTINYFANNNGQHVFSHRGVRTTFGEQFVMATFEGAIQIDSADQNNQAVTLGQMNNAIANAQPTDTIAKIPNYVASTYSKNEVVAKPDAGQPLLYRSLRNANADSIITNWSLLGDTANIQPWESLTAYSKGDYVTQDVGIVAVLRALNDNTGSTPLSSPNWELVGVTSGVYSPSTLYTYYGSIYPLVVSYQAQYYSQNKDSITGGLPLSWEQLTFAKPSYNSGLSYNKKDNSVGIGGSYLGAVDGLGNRLTNLQYSPRIARIGIDPFGIALEAGTPDIPNPGNYYVGSLQITGGLNFYGNSGISNTLTGGDWYMTANNSSNSKDTTGTAGGSSGIENASVFSKVSTDNLIAGFSTFSYPGNNADPNHPNADLLFVSQANGSGVKNPQFYITNKQYGPVPTDTLVYFDTAGGRFFKNLRQNYTPLSIPDVAYVDSVAAGGGASLAVGYGMRIVNDTIQLGADPSTNEGHLSSTVPLLLHDENYRGIDIYPNGYGNYISMSRSSPSGDPFYSSNFQLNTGYQSTNLSSDTGKQVTTTLESNFDLKYSADVRKYTSVEGDTTNIGSLFIRPDSLTIGIAATALDGDGNANYYRNRNITIYSDSAISTGTIELDKDYLFKERSLITKKYADSLFSTAGSSPIGGQGIYMKGDTVNLGFDLTTLGTTNAGALTQDMYLFRGDIVGGTYNNLSIFNGQNVLSARSPGTSNGATIAVENTGRNRANINVSKSGNATSDIDMELISDGTEPSYTLTVANPAQPLTVSQSTRAYDGQVDYFYDADEDQTSFLRGAGTSLALGWYNGNGSSVGSNMVGFEMKSGGFNAYDYYNSGMKYAAKYRANLTNRSIVDKEYVDSAVASAGGSTPGLNSVMSIDSTTTHKYIGTGGMSVRKNATISDTLELGDVNSTPGNAVLKILDNENWGDYYVMVPYGANYIRTYNPGGSFTFSAPTQIGGGNGTNGWSLNSSFNGNYAYRMPDSSGTVALLQNIDGLGLQQITTGAGKNVTDNTVYFTGRNNSSTQVGLSAGTNLSGDGLLSWNNGFAGAGSALTLNLSSFSLLTNAGNGLKYDGATGKTSLTANGVGPITVESAAGVILKSSDLAISDASRKFVTIDSTGNLKAMNISATSDTTILVTTQTVSNTSAFTLITIPIPSDAVWSIQFRTLAKQIGSSPFNGEASSFNSSVIVTNISGTASILGSQAELFTPIKTSGMSNTSVQATVSGANLVIELTGEAGATINWRSLITIMKQP